MTVELVSRAVWGADSPDSFIPIEWDLIRGVVVHHTDGPTPRDFAHAKSLIRGIQSAHMNKGHRDIDYSALAWDRYLFVGRWFSNRPGSNGRDTDGDDFYDEHNRQWLSICFLGSSPEPTEASIATFNTFRSKVQRKAPRATAATYHGALVPNQCPGKPWRDCIKARCYEQEDDMAKLSEEAQEFFEQTFRRLKDLDPDTNPGWAKVLINAHRADDPEPHELPDHTHTPGPVDR